MKLLDKSTIETLTAAFEKAVNGALTMDPKSQKKLGSLEGCILEIRLRNPAISVFFGSEQSRVIILPEHPSPDVTLSGSPIAFVKLATLDDTGLLFKTKELELCGDAVRAQQIQMFAKGINIDWEGLLAEVIGDVPAHFIGTTFRSGWELSKMAGSNFLRDAEEFIKYELSLFPSRQHGEKQFDKIDQLRLATDRLEARVRRIIKRGEKA